MATNEIKGKNVFDRTIKGGVGKGETLKREGTDEVPFDPGLFARVTDVNWGHGHPQITGQFIIVGYCHDGDRFAVLADTDADNKNAQIQYGERGWITSGHFDGDPDDAGTVFAYHTNLKEPVDFDVCLRVKMWGQHALIAAGSYTNTSAVPDFGVIGLVCASLDNGKTWTDLRLPLPRRGSDDFVRFIAWDPATGTLYASAEHQAFLGFNQLYSSLYKFTAGTTPQSGGVWTFLQDDTTGDFSNFPISYYAHIPSVIPAGSYIANDTMFYDDGNGGYKYQGIERSFSWYNGLVTFIGPDGNEHTLEQKVDDFLRLDGEPLPFDDPRYSGFQMATAGNGLIVLSAVQFVERPGFNDYVGVVASADLGQTWQEVNKDLTISYFYLCASFGKNKL